ncbi:MAG: hydantoin racemase, partial [Anaerolineae bacterium]|nr:hydantoin racemase [Anaerolineae bacterium]
MRILWINPIGSEAFNMDTFKVLNEAKSAGTQVDLVSLPADRPRHLQYHAYEGLVVADIVRLTYQAADKYEAIV